MQKYQQLWHCSGKIRHIIDCKRRSLVAAVYSGVFLKRLRPKAEHQCEQILQNKVKGYIGNKGIWAIDRQGDNQELITHFCKQRLRFVTRLKQNRWVQLCNGQKYWPLLYTESLQQHIPLKYKAVVTRIADGRERKVILRFGGALIKIPDLPQWPLHTVVVQGFGAHPMILLTNMNIK